MVFSSITFLCVFLPVVILLYNVIKNHTAKNILLIIASLLFYAYGEPVYVLLMVLCAFFNYLLAIQIEKVKSLAQGDETVSEDADNKATVKCNAKGLLVLTVIVDIGILCIFKYLSMLVSLVNIVPNVRIADPGIALPIGISFFTFQAVSYVVDVYEGRVSADKSFLNILLYISFFPQLIAGPIVKYHDIDLEIKDRSVSINDMADGIKRFIYGLSKKVLIANTLGQAADYVYGLNSNELCALSVWVGAICYMLQIYFDFSGYSDMAIGLGRMFGFHFKENFDYPYSAASIQEFWRRWHISLTNWFREYVYIPLGGNRKGQTRTWINRLFVFFLTGLWHGANVTFILWGLFHGLFLTIETISPKFTKKLGKLSRIYVLIVVCVGFVLFRSDNVSQAMTMIQLMFTGFSIDASRAVMLQGLFSGLLVFTLVIAIALAGGIFKKINKENGWYKKSEYVITVLLLILCMISLAGSTYNPFIYFRF